jgi:hypothetical protein
MARHAVLATLAVLAGVAFAACSEAPNDETGGNFIAVNSDFEGYTTNWKSYNLGADVSDGIHAEGDRIVYLNQAPPHGSTSFPDGTILVKVIMTGTAQTTPLAMVKRGGTYNNRGAAGWEWFELTAGDAAAIVWRGVGPPTGEVYSKVCGSSSTGNGCCNDCHSNARANDFVAASLLSLKNF